LPDPLHKANSIIDYLVGAVGIEPLRPLKERKLFIPRFAKYDKSDRNAKPKYVPGTPKRTNPFPVQHVSTLIRMIRSFVTFQSWPPAGGAIA
jgi:hypothetical protein